MALNMANQADQYVPFRASSHSKPQPYHNVIFFLGKVYKDSDYKHVTAVGRSYLYDRNSFVYR